MSQCTEKQAGLLRKFNYDPTGLTFEQARGAIDQIRAAGWKRPDGQPSPGDQQNNGGCTAKQAAVLERAGYSTVGVTFEQASQLIDQLKANNWQPIDQAAPAAAPAPPVGYTFAPQQVPAPAAQPVSQAPPVAPTNAPFPPGTFGAPSVPQNISPPAPPSAIPFG